MTPRVSLLFTASVAVIAAIVLANTASHQEVSCPCTFADDGWLRRHQVNVNVAIRGVLASSPCMSQDTATITLDDAWLSYLAKEYPGNGCAVDGCGAKGLYTGQRVLLPVPWSKARTCGMLTSIVAVLVQTLIPNVRYVAVHELEEGLFARQETAALTAFNVTQLHPSGTGGYHVPKLPMHHVINGQFDGGGQPKQFLLGFCTSHSDVLESALSDNATVDHSSHDWTGVAKRLVSMLRDSTLGIPFGVCSVAGAAGLQAVSAASEFVLCPRGFGPACDDLLSIIEHGAIPVYVWSGHHVLPYKRSLPWEDLVLSLHASQLDKLQLLMVQPRDRIASMRARLHAYVSRYFTTEAVLQHVEAWFASPEHSVFQRVLDGPSLREPAVLSIAAETGDTVTLNAFPENDRERMLALLCATMSRGNTAVKQACLTVALNDERSQRLWFGAAAVDLTNMRPEAGRAMIPQLMRSLLRHFRMFERVRRDLLFELQTVYGPVDISRRLSIDLDALPTIWGLAREHALGLPRTHMSSKDLFDQLTGAHLPIENLLTFVPTSYLLNFGSVADEMKVMQLTRDDCLPRLPMSDSDMVTCFGDLYRSVCKVVVYTTVGYRDPQDPHWNLTLNAVTPDCDTACVWTANRSCLHGGDAVLVADWVAYQVPPKICGQKRILLQLESPLLTHSLMPRQHYEQYYDGVSTYRLDSDIPFPYFPYDGRGSESELFADPMPFHDKRTDALAVMMISNCDMASNGRLEYAQELMDHLPVHSYGECLHNRDFPPSDSDEYSRLKYASNAADAVLRQYKFILVFENSNCIDYVSEKLWRAYRIGVVPVYMGAQNVRQHFTPNPHAIIETSAFTSPAALAQHLHYLAGNVTAYNTHLQHKTDRRIDAHFRELWFTPKPSWQCRVCGYIASSKTRSFYRDESCVVRMGMY